MKSHPTGKSAASEPGRWTVYVCPNCREHELQRGAYRGRCPGCNTYFSVDDERPEPMTKWDRGRHPQPSIPVPVVPCDPEALRRAAEALLRAPPATPEEHVRLVVRTLGGPRP